LLFVASRTNIEIRKLIRINNKIKEATKIPIRKRGGRLSTADPKMRLDNTTKPNAGIFFIISFLLNTAIGH